MTELANWPGVTLAQVHDGAVVLEAVVRSFAPPAPLVVRWEFPLWVPDDSLDPAALKRPKSGSDQQQEKRDREADEAVLQAASDWKSRTELKRDTGMGDGRVSRSVNRLVEASDLLASKGERRGVECELYRDRNPSRSAPSRREDLREGLAN